MRGAAAAVCLLLAAGCTTPVAGQSSTEPPVSSESAGVVPTELAPGDSAGPSTSPTPTCSSAAPPSLTVSTGTLPEGTSFGFVRFFDGTAVYVDPAELFGDEAAETAAREDGEIGPHEGLPNPFYIRNRSTAVVRVPVSATLRVQVLDNQDVAEHSITAAEFATLYCAEARPDWLYSNPEDLPAKVTMVRGEVTRIEEEYLP